MQAKHEATIQDLAAVPQHGRAELVNGKIVLIPYMSIRAARSIMCIFLSLYEYEGTHPGAGMCLTSKVGYVVDLPHSKSFCPDCSFYTGPRTMGFPVGAPVFAVEMRDDKEDYGPEAEIAHAAKRADYFATGSKVVWDVDLKGEDVVRVYRIDTPDTPTIYRRGEVAEAEPAIPGWLRRISPLPLQVGQTCGSVPGSAPLPSHLGQVARRGISTSFSEPR